MLAAMLSHASGRLTGTHWVKGQSPGISKQKWGGGDRPKQSSLGLSQGIL